MSNENLMHTGIVFPRETLKKIDERRGRYISRNKYLLKIVEEHLNENGNNNELIKNLPGSRIETPASQAVTTAVPTTTPTLLPRMESDDADASKR